MSHLELVALVVRDYDAAIRFFVDVLQFELVEDTPAQTNDGRPKRWVVVRPNGGQTRILLARADGEQQMSSVGRQFAGRVGMFLRVDDFEAAYQRMVAAGVRFVSPPRDEPYGRVAVFLDIEGNRWDLLGRDPRRGARIDSASRLIKAPAERIYLAFVTPESLVRWLPPTGMKGRIEAFEARAGGELRIVLTYDEASHPAPGKTSEHADAVQGRFLELVPNQRIVQSVRFESNDPTFAGEMKMTWLLQPAPGGTTVVIRAENVPAGISAEDHEAGFKASLQNLAAFVEQ